MADFTLNKKTATTPRVSYKELGNVLELWLQLFFVSCYCNKGRERFFGSLVQKPSGSENRSLLNTGKDFPNA
jgi:hypothetical protein